MVNKARGSAAAPGKSGRFTVVGLFGTSLDAEQALVALRRAARPPEQVSVLVRRRANEDGREDGTAAVAKAVVENALDAVGGWLTGLAALIIPKDGSYLVAGPLGAALAGMRGRRAVTGIATGAASASDYAPALAATEDDVFEMLVDFGFKVDEATYIDHRLEAGDVVVAVTTADRTQLKSTRRLFADQDAVHIGQARTKEAVAHEAFSLLAAPIAAAAGGEIVVADATTPLRRLCPEPGVEPWVQSTCGQPIVDRDGLEVGDVDDFLADAIGDGDADDRRREVRYVVIGFGGVLGLGRHHAAVPSALVSLETNPARLAITGDLLGRAPHYEPEAPFSRREELVIFAFFGVEPYWSK
ncbi:MAG: hypothetical protein ACRDJH_03285 [Thermomicrobiales bacterium]